MSAMTDNAPITTKAKAFLNTFLMQRFLKERQLVKMSLIQVILALMPRRIISMAGFIKRTIDIT